MNYDGSRGKKIGKTKIKDNTRSTNERKHILYYGISRRITEEDILNDVSTLFHQKKGRRSFVMKVTFSTEVMLQYYVCCHWFSSCDHLDLTQLSTSFWNLNYLIKPF